MAFKSKNTNKDAKEYFDLQKNMAAVKNIRVLSGTCISFTLKCSGFSFYNMRLVESRDGGRYIFSGQSQGRDGKYYDNYAVYLTAEDKAKLINEVLSGLEKLNEKS